MKIQNCLALAAFSGLIVGVVAADDLHWLNAVLAAGLYGIVSTLAAGKSR